MQYYLKVTPKGQVILPKKLREALQVEDILEVDLEDSGAVMKKPEGTSRSLAGCFREYAAKENVAVEQALEQAREMVAHEIAAKNH